MENLSSKHSSGSASLEAHQALEKFSEVYPNSETRSWVVSHPNRVANYVKGFAGDKVDDLVYDATLLHSVVGGMDESMPEQVQAAAQSALKEYFVPKSEIHQRYMSCILGDAAVSEQAARRYSSDPALAMLRNNLGRDFNNNNGKTIPAEYWEILTPTPDIDAMAELARTTNIESQIPRGARLLDRLVLLPINEIYQLQNNFEAEYFDAPFFEILGYDGLAMAIRDAALQVKFTKTGKTAYLEQAKTLHEEAKKMSVKRMFSLILGKDRFTLQNVVDRSLLDIGEFTFVDSENNLAAGNYRIKTVGSLAAKIERYGGAPMDTFAATVIEKDVTTSAKAFAKMTLRMHQLDEHGIVNLMPAKSKKKALYAKGNSDYLKAVKRELVAVGLDPDVCLDDEPDEDGGYEVSKMTFHILHDGVETPAEVQFVTKETRHAARLGRLAHHVFKSGHTSVDPAALELIYERKSRMTNDPKSEDYLRVNKKSMARGAVLLEKIMGKGITVVKVL